MKTLLLSQLYLPLIFALVGCTEAPGGKDTGTPSGVTQKTGLLDSQAKAMLQDCFGKAEIVTAVGPMLAKSPSETEVHFVYTDVIPSAQKGHLKTVAVFKVDQAGKYYLVDIDSNAGYEISPTNWNNCRGKLPLGSK